MLLNRHQDFDAHGTKTLTVDSKIELKSFCNNIIKYGLFHYFYYKIMLKQKTTINVKRKKIINNINHIKVMR